MVWSGGWDSGSQVPSLPPIPKPSTPPSHPQSWVSQLQTRLKGAVLHKDHTHPALTLMCAVSLQPVSRQSVRYSWACSMDDLLSGADGSLVTRAVLKRLGWGRRCKPLWTPWGEGVQGPWVMSGGSEAGTVGG